MRSGSLLALWALAAAPALAQQAAQLTGTVTNALTGLPVARAHVSLRGEKNFGAVTNGEGKYSISGVPAGNYRVGAERVGFTTENRSGAGGVELHIGDNSFDVKLFPLGGIGGRVVDADGEPVQLARVIASATDGDDHTATTDDKGQYRIGGLRPGKYRIEVIPESSPEEIRTDGSKQVHYRSTYFPGVPSPAGSTGVKVAAGSEAAGIDVKLLTTALVKVSGKVLNTPKDASSVVVYVESDVTENESESSGVTCAPDGAFVVPGLEPGKYTLRAETDEGAVHSAPLDLDLSAGNVEHAELRLVPPFAISGHIEYEDDAARDSAKNPVEGLRGTMLRDRTVRFGRVQADIGPDDSFTLEKVQPDRGPVSVVLGDTYVRSVRLGSVESDDRMLDVRNGSGSAPLTVVVSVAWGEINGTVSNSAGPVAGATVMLIEERGANGATTDSSGHYSIEHIVPGKYQLVASDERARELWGRSFDLDDYKDGLVSVEVHAGDKITQDLKQILPDK